jgi:hypothetical protein
MSREREDDTLAKWPVHMRRWFWKRVGRGAFLNEVSKDPDPEILSHLTSEQGRPPQ